MSSATSLMVGNVNVKSWLEEFKEDFKPPVCNKMMSGGQLKVMFVGGPNQRKDYHIEEGEEFFYQLKGDMILKVIERGIEKDIHIHEGEVFVLPVRIQHSPQRTANSCGLVIERERANDEMDGLRYFCEGSTDVLYEKYFHCENLGTQLKPLIETFFASDAYRTGKPKVDSVVDSPPLNIDNVNNTPLPFSLMQWIEEHESILNTDGVATLFSGGEFTICVHKGGVDSEDKLKRASPSGCETWFYMLKGDAKVSTFEDGKTTNFNLCQDDICTIKPDIEYNVVREPGSLGLTAFQNPNSKTK